MGDRIEVPVLIVGAGGAGLAATIFLADLGIEALTVERHPGTSNLPKAHYLNQRTMEILRLHNVADAVYAAAAPRDNMGRIHWITSLGGDGEFDRITFHTQSALGGGPGLTEQYDAKGCAHPTHIPQVYLEPILRDIALVRSDGRIRYGHEVVAVRPDDDGVTAITRDHEADAEVEIRCRYLLAADAGRTVGPELGIDVAETTMPQRGWATVWFAADLSEYIGSDDAVIRFIFHPGRPDRMGGMRANGPAHWDRHSEEWVVAFTVDRSVVDTDQKVVAEAMDLVRLDVPHEVRRVSYWGPDTKLADTFSAGRAFLVGDAAHQHPPTGGLGLNSAIQDAHNLAWKLKLVLDDVAPASLLDSYESERRPVVIENTEWSLGAGANHATLLAALGASPGTPPERSLASFRALMSDTRVGRARRAIVKEVFSVQRTEYAAHDVEMGFAYADGALVEDGSPEPERDPMGSEYRPTSRPGARLPHGWLHSDGRRVSTHDLIPPGGFLLLVGADGLAWRVAAERVAADRGVTIRTVSVGPGADATDPSGAWTAAREVSDSGAILVRPDGHVGFRSVTAAAEPYVVLDGAIDRIITGAGRTEAPRDAGVVGLSIGGQTA